MSNKRPVLLTVLIEPQSFRWYVAGIDLSGTVTPLLCSQKGNFAGYIDQPFDDQTSYLRHHLAGVLQRGCDRLWGRQEKPCQIVFVSEGAFLDAPPELTSRVAEHFVEWMTSPPVVFFLREPSETGEESSLTPIAGEITPGWLTAVVTGLPQMISQCSEDDPWELIMTKPSIS